MNAITYKNIFPRISRNEMWLGNGFQSGAAYFRVLNGDNYAKGVFNEETGLVKFGNCRWYTNLDHGRRHEPLQLMTIEENLRYSRHKEIRGKTFEEAYPRYDNYDAIEVSYTDAIPRDYYGVMGVPISFLDKYCPTQFEILGATESEGKGFSRGLWHPESGVSQPIVERERESTALQAYLHSIYGYQDTRSMTALTYEDEGSTFASSFVLALHRNHNLVAPMSRR